MTKVWQAFLILLAQSTDKELARMLEFLKAENKILRSKLPRIVSVTPAEKSLLLKLGKALGTKIRELISIVSPRTFARWLAAEISGKTPTKTSSLGGRPKTADDLRDLVLRFASENGWGFGRIVGELKRLGLSISKSTVKAILREHGYDLGPNRSQGTWSEFVERHAKTLWACDFFQKKIWTTTGPVDYFLLFFIHVGSRRVFLAGITDHPTHAWVTQQARNLTLNLDQEVDKPTHLIRDNDNKYSASFDQIFESEDMKVIKTAIAAPNQNAFIERWIQSLQVECLDHFVVFGEGHLRHLVSGYLEYYNGPRPHQGLDNKLLDNRILTPSGPITKTHIECHEQLGGLLRVWSLWHQELRGKTRRRSPL